MSSIVVVGGCISDLISYVSRFPRPGETFAGHNFLKGCGGKAANQCVMAQKLGAPTAMIAKVGDDSFGQEHLENFRKLNVHSEFVTISKTSNTSTASILVTDDGENCIVFVPGAINELTPEDIFAAENVIKQSQVLLATYECPLTTLLAAFTLARKYKVKTVLNAAPSVDATYEKLYPLTDIICMNEIEAEDATNLPAKDLANAEAIIKKLQEKGCSTVILTLGAKGAVFQTKTDEKYGHVQTKSVKAVDCTGAGDAFMGSLVYFLAHHPNLSLKTTIEKSCEIATMSVLKKGTQFSFPNREDIPDSLLCIE
ncbi:hypothetical protein JTE90_000123 [Oedothorax gibbosus]|uniref:Ribokinase n=1 Tax=Oedothorax gibbosus TaxID=931172 RepID=A0AAV6V1P8_9ARAC|nr:hypothetical protein JTE90_000123 [Oedothorax gibbosus]